MKSALLAALTACIVLCSAATVLAAPPPPDLGGESWRASADIHPDYGTPGPNDVVTTTERTCDPMGGATLTQIAEGDAEGPYPGRFGEEITVELGPVVRDVFDDRDVRSASGSFSVDSALGQVAGSFDFDPALTHQAGDPSTPAASGWCLNESPDFSTPHTVAGGAFTRYEATITTPDGCTWTDHGGDADPTDDSVHAGGFEVGHAPYPEGRTVALNFQSDGAPLEQGAGCESPSTFDGFFAPVDNLPVLNEVDAGRAIPVKFSLGVDQGLDIFAAGYPSSQQVDCSEIAHAQVDGVEETTAAGSSSLSYNAGSDRYHYVWKTAEAWSGTCRQFVLKLHDGSVHRANFSFK